MGGLFKTFGPFDLERDEGAVNKDAILTLFSSDAKHLKEAIGVYVLALQVKKGSSIPWYVGQTQAGFLKRLLQHSRAQKGFGDVGRIPKNGHLTVFIMALASEKTGEFQKPSTTRKKILSVRLLEQMLIDTCLRLNQDLLNTSYKTLYKAMRVPGFIDHKATERDAPASALAKMLEID